MVVFGLFRVALGQFRQKVTRGGAALDEVVRHNDVDDVFGVFDVLPGELGDVQ